MNARRFLTLLTAVLITAGEAVIFAADTASTASQAAPQVADAPACAVTWRIA